MRLDIRRVTDVKEGEEKIGSRVKVRVVKNKVAAPFRLAEFDLMFDRGISREGDLIDLALEDKLVDKSGSWLNYGETRLGQGRENAKQYLRDNPALVEEITKKILEKRGVEVANLPTQGVNGEAQEASTRTEPAKRESKKQPVATE